MADETDETVQKPDPLSESAPSRSDLAAQIAELEQALLSLSSVVSSLSARTLRAFDDMRAEVDLRPTSEEFAPFRRDIERLRGRLEDIIDEVGYGESLDIAKVPPQILEAAYQGILDDVIAQLKKARGSHDAGTHVRESLELLRQKTSGSELFHYSHHRLEVGVRKPLERGHISARQVQMTFEELLRHLLEPIHTYQPRNFRALIKIKSQEYAVNTAMNLEADVRPAKESLASLQARVRRLEEQVTGALRDVKAFAERLEPMLANAATRESVESLALRVEGLERLRGAPAAPSPDPDLEKRILDALGEGGLTATALARTLSLERDSVKAVLEDMEQRNLLSSTTKGRTKAYRTKEEHDDA